VLRISLLFCISIAVVAVVWAEPSPTPNQIISHIPRQRVESSAIAAAGYVNGAIYRYLDVPSAVHRDLMSAESKARFYDSNIRRHYRSVLVQPQHTSRSGN